MPRASGNEPLQYANLVEVNAGCWRRQPCKILGTAGGVLGVILLLIIGFVIFYGFIVVIRNDAEIIGPRRDRRWNRDIGCC